MDVAQAQRAIESLRMGIPPEGLIRHFTVGRKDEIKELIDHLGSRGSALLLNANYGAGKTHLLRFIREEALDQGFLVSGVTLEANAAVRFNRMDQVFGAVCRGMEFPGPAGGKGLRPFFDLVADSARKRSQSAFWKSISNDGKWDCSETLDSPGLYVALRAWSTNDEPVKDLVENWLCQPWEYRTQREVLHLQLVAGLRAYFRDPRPDWRFYAENVFSFHTQGHAQSWAALRDFHRLARESGLRGLVILFDEFESAVTDLRNVKFQEDAFLNLFAFYSGKRFPGKTYYAVTPQFVEACKTRLIEKGRWDIDLARFDDLPSFEMSPLAEQHMLELSRRIREAYKDAYNWDACAAVHDRALQKVMHDTMQTQVQDRTRQAVKAIVRLLDSRNPG